jgi:membrane-bound serine protease (ClpP class)
VRRLAIALLAAGALLGLAGVAGAQTPSASGPAPVDVAEVSGLLDAPLASFVDQAITRAETDGAQALVLQLSSSGTTLGADRLTALADRIRSATVPVTIWVGPSN